MLLKTEQDGNRGTRNTLRTIAVIKNTATDEAVRTLYACHWCLSQAGRVLPTAGAAWTSRKSRRLLIKITENGRPGIRHKAQGVSRCCMGHVAIKVLSSTIAVAVTDGSWLTLMDTEYYGNDGKIITIEAPSIWTRIRTCPSRTSRRSGPGSVILLLLGQK